VPGRAGKRWGDSAGTTKPSDGNQRTADSCGRSLEGQKEMHSEPLASFQC
jgi:hypothetical protein